MNECVIGWESLGHGGTGSDGWVTLVWGCGGEPSRVHRSKDV